MFTYKYTHTGLQLGLVYSSSSVGKTFSWFSPALSAICVCGVGFEPKNSFLGRFAGCKAVRLAPTRPPPKASRHACMPTRSVFLGNSGRSLAPHPEGRPSNCDTQKPANGCICREALVSSSSLTLGFFRVILPERVKEWKKPVRRDSVAEQVRQTDDPRIPRRIGETPKTAHACLSNAKPSRI